MTSTPSLTYQTSGPHCAVVSLAGDWDASGAVQVVASVSRAIEEGRSCVVVDLEGATFIDSTMLRALLNLDKAAVQGRWGLALAMPENGPVRRLFELTALDRRFRILPSRDAALSALQEATL